MTKEKREKIAELAAAFFESSDDLVFVSNSIEDLINRKLERSVGRKIVELGVAALNSFTEAELEWYSVNLAPKVEAQIRSSRDTAAVGRLYCGNKPEAESILPRRKGGRP